MKTHRSPTPIERAIDRSCGRTESPDVPIFLPIRCPTCELRGHTPALESDPEGTKEIVLECPACTRRKSTAKRGKK